MPSPQQADSQRETQQKKPTETQKVKTQGAADQQKAKPGQSDKIPVSGFQDGFNFIDKIIDEEESEPKKPDRNQKI